MVLSAANCAHKNLTQRRKQARILELEQGPLKRARADPRTIQGPISVLVLMKQQLPIVVKLPMQRSAAGKRKWVVWKVPAACLRQQIMGVCNQVNKQHLL